MNIVVNKPKLTSQIIKENRIGNKIIDKENITYKELDFNGCLHSTIVEEEMFTNYIKSYDKKIYLELKEIFDDIYKKGCKLEDKFRLLNNEEETNREPILRLKRIISKGNYIKNVPSLMKFEPKHPKDDKTLEPVRIYIHYDEVSQIFELYLIDLYHLGIDAKNYNIGNGVYDLDGRFKANLENKKCISKISDEYIDIKKTGTN